MIYLIVIFTNLFCITVAGKECLDYFQRGELLDGSELTLSSNIYIN